MRVRVKSQPQKEGLHRSKRILKRHHFNLVKFLKSFVIILLIIFLLESGWILLTSFYVKPVIASWDTIENGTWVEAIFLRYETPLFAPSEGELELKVANGTRVPAGEILAQIKQNSANVPRNQAVLQVEPELSEEQKLLQADLARLEAEIAQKKNLTKVTIAGKINEDLKNLLAEKTKLNKMIFELNQNQLKLGKNAAAPSLVAAPCAGIWYAEIDGLENQLTPAALTKLSSADFKQKVQFHRPQKQILAREAFGKLVKPFDQVIVVVAREKKMKQANQGTKWLIRTGNDTYKVTVANKFTTSDGKLELIALTDPVLPANWLPQRLARIYLVYQRTSGVMIPTQAIYHQKGVTLVRISDENGTHSGEVKVVAIDGGKAIVEGIQIGTTVLTKLF